MNENIELNENNYIEVYQKLDYLIHYNGGIFKIKGSENINKLSIQDLIYNATSILDQYYEANIEITEQGITINGNSKYRFLNSYSKETVKQWIKTQIKNKLQLDSYIRFNYNCHLNELSKYELFEIILDYV